MKHCGRRVLVLSLVIVIGCGEAEVTPQETISSVEITLEGRFTLDTVPVVVIGGGREAPGHSLYLVMDARLLSDGSVAVAQGGSQNVVYFDSLGNTKGEAGGPGDGPGEFRRIRSLHPLGGDTLFAWDPVPARLTLLTLNGKGPTVDLRTSPDPEGLRSAVTGEPLDMHLLTPGRLIVEHRDHNFDPQKHVRESIALSVVSGEGEYVRNLEVLQGEEWYRGITVPLGYRFYAAVSNGVLYASDGTGGTLAAYDSTGDRVETLRLPAQRTALSNTDKQAALDGLLARVSERARKAVEERLATMPLPDSAPVLTGLRAARDGALWMRLYSRPQSSSSKWLVVDPQTKSAHSIDIPKRYELLDASGDRVLMMSQDSLDREALYVFRYGAREM